MPRLDFYANYELFVRIKLDASDVLIGRGENCTIQLPDDRVSRVHALIRPRGAGHELVDRSLNGTKLNHGTVRGTALLQPGDRIYIERYILIYQPDEASDVDLSLASTTRQ